MEDNNHTTVAKASTGLGDLVDEIPNPPRWLKDALAVPREEGIVTVDGCALHYFRWGDRRKPAIIMTHGFLAHARCFAFIAPYLANDFHLVAFDMSGMGESSTHNLYTTDLRVKELLGVAEQTGLCDNGGKPTIIAHSFGGLVSTAAVHAHPDKFAGLIICDLMIIRPSVLAAHRDKFSPPGRKRGDQPNNVYPDYPTAKQRFVLSPPQATNEPALFDYMAYHSLKRVSGGWSWKFDPAVFSRVEGVKQTWSEIGQKVATAPVRKAIIHGLESLLFTADSANYMNELAEQNGEETIPIIGIPHARHHLMLDQPIAFVTALKSVLETWAKIE